MPDARASTRVLARVVAKLFLVGGANIIALLTIRTV